MSWYATAAQATCLASLSLAQGAGGLPWSNPVANQMGQALTPGEAGSSPDTNGRSYDAGGGLSPSGSGAGDGFGASSSGPPLWVWVLVAIAAVLLVTAICVFFAAARRRRSRREYYKAQVVAGAGPGGVGPPPVGMRLHDGGASPWPWQGWGAAAGAGTGAEAGPERATVAAGARGSTPVWARWLGQSNKPAVATVAGAVAPGTAFAPIVHARGGTGVVGAAADGAGAGGGADKGGATAPTADPDVGPSTLDRGALHWPGLAAQEAAGIAGTTRKSYAGSEGGGGAAVGALAPTAAATELVAGVAASPDAHASNRFSKPSVALHCRRDGLMRGSGYSHRSTRPEDDPAMEALAVDSVPTPPLALCVPGSTARRSATANAVKPLDGQEPDMPHRVGPHILDEWEVAHVAPGSNSLGAVLPGARIRGAQEAVEMHSSRVSFIAPAHAAGAPGSPRNERLAARPLSTAANRRTSLRAQRPLSAGVEALGFAAPVQRHVDEGSGIGGGSPASLRGRVTVAGGGSPTSCVPAGPPARIRRWSTLKPAPIVVAASNTGEAAAEGSGGARIHGLLRRYLTFNNGLSNIAAATPPQNAMIPEAPSSPHGTGVIEAWAELPQSRLASSNPVHIRVVDRAQGSAPDSPTHGGLPQDPQRGAHHGPSRHAPHRPSSVLGLAALKTSLTANSTTDKPWDPLSSQDCTTKAPSASYSAATAHQASIHAMPSLGGEAPGESRPHGFGDRSPRQVQAYHPGSPQNTDCFASFLPTSTSRRSSIMDMLSTVRGRHNSASSRSASLSTATLPVSAAGNHLSHAKATPIPPLHAAATDSISSAATASVFGTSDLGPWRTGVLACQPSNCTLDTGTSITHPSLHSTRSRSLSIASTPPQTYGVSSRPAAGGSTGGSAADPYNLYRNPLSSGGHEQYGTSDLWNDEAFDTLGSALHLQLPPSEGLTGAAASTSMGTSGALPAPMASEHGTRQQARLQQGHDDPGAVWSDSNDEDSWDRARAGGVAAGPGAGSRPEHGSRSAEYVLVDSEPDHTFAAAAAQPGGSGGNAGSRAAGDVPGGAAPESPWLGPAGHPHLVVPHAAAATTARVAAPKAEGAAPPGLLLGPVGVSLEGSYRRLEDMEEAFRKAAAAREVYNRVLPVSMRRASIMGAQAAAGQGTRDGAAGSLKEV